MKKLLFLFLVLVLMLGTVVACGPSATPTTSQAGSQPTATVTKTVTATPAAPTTKPLQTYTLKFQAYMDDSTTHIKVGCKQYFIPTLEELSDGRIKVEFYSMNALCNTADMVDAIKAGTLDMGQTAQGYYKGIIGPLVDFLNFPGEGTTASQIDLMYHFMGWDKVKREGYAKGGCYLVTSLTTTAYGMCTKMPVNSLADLKGKKIRGYSSYSTLFEKLGMSPVTMAYGELYTGLSTGVIDGAIFGDESVMYSSSMYEVAPYLVQPPFCWVNNDLIMNEDLYNEMDQSLKTAVDVSGRYWSDAQDAFLAADKEIAKAKMGSKLTQCQLPASDIETINKAVSELWDELAAKESSDPLVAELMATKKAYDEYMGR